MTKLKLWHERGWRKHLPRFLANWLMLIRLAILIPKTGYKLTKFSHNSLEFELKGKTAKEQDETIKNIAIGK